MEFLIGIGIALVTAALVGRGRKSRATSKTQALTSEQRKQQETDEIITVILPTINNDK